MSKNLLTQNRIHCARKAHQEHEKDTREMMECPYCSGRGNVTMNIWGTEYVERCPLCNGTGEVEEVEEIGK